MIKSLYVKRITYTIFIILILTVIFCFSSQTGPESKGVSDTVRQNTIEKLAENEKTQNFVLSKEKEIDVFIRKSAHIFLYMFLGLFSFLLADTFFQGRYIISLIISFLFSVLYGAIDEFHQTFVAGRAGKPLDVGIDAVGVAIGILIGFLIIKKQKNKLKTK